MLMRKHTIDIGWHPQADSLGVFWSIDLTTPQTPMTAFEGATRLFLKICKLEIPFGKQSAGVIWIR
jgi:hypothetical protein